jgi:hypothetical protein
MSDLCMVSGHTTEQEIRDLRFNAFRAPRSDVAKDLVRGVIHRLEALEVLQGLRVRCRKAVDQITFKRQVGALICDAALLELTRPGAALSVSLSKRHLSRKDRYRSNVTSKTLPLVLQRLGSGGLGLLDVNEGFQNPFNRDLSRTTTFRLSLEGRRALAAAGLTASDFELAEEQEIVVLKSKKQSRANNGEYLQYDDTAQIIQFRSHLRRINAFIEQADLGIVTDETSVAPHDRRLRRIFNNGVFTEGGRLFGGFWQQMKKDRRKSIRIDGCSMVTLDYGQMGPRLLYSLAKTSYCVGDAYHLPGLERFRGDIKKLMGAMMIASRPFSRYPEGIDNLRSNRIPLKAVIEAITLRHASVAHLFNNGVGMKTMFIESEILLEVLLRLMEQGIVALPIHDAVMVSECDEDQAKEVMYQVFREKTGIDGLVQVTV